MRKALHSARYARLTLGWLEWLSSLALPSAEDGDAPSLRRHATKRVRRLFGHLYASPSLTSLDTAARHQVRIDAKRLRYALEFFASLASRRTRTDTVKTLARVQSVLGEANDTMVALQHLENWLRRRTSSGSCVATARRSSNARRATPRRCWPACGRRSSTASRVDRHALTIMAARFPYASR